MQIPNMANKNVWVYWENLPGKETPIYIQLCLQTIQKYSDGLNVRLVNEDTIRDYIDVHDKVRELKCIAHKADYYRVHLVQKYGGIALDADTIILRDLWYIFEQLASHNFVGFEDDYGPRVGVFASVANGNIITEWAKKQYNRLMDSRELEWTSLGTDLLWPICNNFPYMQNDWNLTHPVKWEDHKKLLDNLEINDIINDKTIAVSLFNRHLSEYVANMDGKQLLHSDMLLSKLFIKSLGVKKDSQCTILVGGETFIDEKED